MSTTTFKQNRIYKSVDFPKGTRGIGSAKTEEVRKAGRPENPVIAAFKAKATQFEVGDFLPLVEIENNDDMTIKKTLNTVRTSIDSYLKKSGLKDEGYAFTTNLVEGTNIVGTWRKS